MMTKNKKRLFCFMLSVLMITQLSIPGMAIEYGNEETNERSMDAELLLRGYPQVYLDFLSLSAKKSLYEKKDLVFAGAVISSYDEETGTFVDMDIPADGIIPRGQIPASDLSLAWGLSQYSTSGNVLVTYSYEWLNFPINRYQDEIAISWDDQLFYMVSGSFYKVDKFIGRPLIDHGSSTRPPAYGSPETVIHSEERGYANASPSGVAWYADLPGYFYEHQMESIYGHGEFLLEPRVSSGRTVFYGHYVHALSQGSISIGIPKYGFSFTVSSNGRYDERGTDRSFTF